MKKLFLSRKVITLVFLLLGILATVLPIKVVLGASAKDPNQSSWRIEPQTSTGVMNLSSISQTPRCLHNNTTNSYFVPYNTLNEWNAFLSTMSLSGAITRVACSGDGTCDTSMGETCATDPGACGVCQTSSCGDELCGTGETSVSCPEDCPGCCLEEGASPTNCSSPACVLSLGTNNYCSEDCDQGRYYSYSSLNTYYLLGDSTSGCRKKDSPIGCARSLGCFWMDPLSQCHSWYGDNICDASIGENCHTALNDCGGCLACGTCSGCSSVNGTCEGSESCSSCPHDCGVCTVDSFPCTGIGAMGKNCTLYTTQVSCEKYGCTWYGN